MTNKLYKYKAFNFEQIRRDLNFLYYADPQFDFNDPYDCAYQIIKNQITFDEVLKKHLPGADLLEANKAYQVLLSHFEIHGCLSLTTQPDNMLMWSHYANSHTGFCIQYDTESEDFPKRNEIYKVEYVESLPSYTQVIEAAKYHGGEVELTRLLFAQKYRDWKYEDERRLIAQDTSWQINKKFRSRHIKDKMTISGIIFGCRMSELAKTVIQNVVKSANFNPIYYQAEPSQKEYKMDITDLTDHK